MSTSLPYGILTPGLLGVGMREVVRRAMSLVRAERFTHETFDKPNEHKADDKVTSTDPAVQELCVALLKEFFPGYGIVAEEGPDGKNYSLPSVNGLFWTLDPLDGTKAFTRYESTGVGVMLALVHAETGTVIAVCVGSPFTEEVFYFRPESPKTHQIDLTLPPALGLRRLDQQRRDRPLKDQYLQLRDGLGAYGPALGTMVVGKRFKDIETASGSIGISMSRLWTGVVGAVALKPGHQTPWDSAPIVGISLKLGFVFVALESSMRDNRIVRADMRITTEYRETTDTILVVHETNLPEIQAWLDAEP